MSPKTRRCCCIFAICFPRFEVSGFFGWMTEIKDFHVLICDIKYVIMFSAIIQNPI